MKERETEKKEKKELKRKLREREKQKSGVDYSRNFTEFIPVLLAK